MATVRSVAKKLRDAMGREAGKAAAPLVTTTMPGTVIAVDGRGNATVDMGNGQQATVMLGIGAHAGDHVDVEFGDMSAVATRNRTDPPDNRIARDAEKVADEAAAVANATGQHFWDDDNGVHVADETRDDWDEEWAKTGHGSIGTPTDQRPWHNILMNSLGLLLRTGINNLVGITRSAVAFYDGLGSAAANVVARFGIDGARIGKTSGTYVSIDYDSFDVVDGSGAYPFTKASFSQYSMQVFPTDATEFYIGKPPDAYNEGDQATGLFFYLEGGNLFRVKNYVSNGYGHFDLDAYEGTLNVHYNGQTNKTTMYVDGTINGVDVSDSGWKTFQCASGAQAYDANSTPRYRKWGNVVNFKGAFKPTAEVAASGSLKLGTLPTGYRPTGQKIDVLCQGSGSNVWLLTLQTNGTVTAARYRSGTANQAMTTSVWLPFNVTFMV